MYSELSWMYNKGKEDKDDNFQERFFELQQEQSDLINKVLT